MFHSLSALPQRLELVASEQQWFHRARALGFCRRRGRKIKLLPLLQALCLCAAQPTMSLRLLAACFGCCAGGTLSKQAVHQRLTPEAVEFVKAALAATMARLAQQTARVKPAALGMFRRLLVQDSTAVGLPARLAGVFAGNANGQGQALAVLKIQAVLDVLAERFVAWRITSFRVNDQQAAADVLEVARAGDLVVRDLGYFSLPVWGKLRERGAHFLSRLHPGVKLYAPDGETEWDLPGLLREHGRLDMLVRLGSEEQLPARLVAVPVAAAVANERRRKARQNQRHPPGPKRLFLLGWDILVTSVESEVWSAATVCAVYGLRWRIEIVFKSWKSHLQWKVVPAGGAVEVEILFWARLLLVTLLHGWLAAEMALGAGPPLSLLKVAQWFGQWGAVLLLGDLVKELPQRWQEQLRYHCRYERRRKRHNFPEKLAMLT